MIADFGLRIAELQMWDVRCEMLEKARKGRLFRISNCELRIEKVVGDVHAIMRFLFDSRFRGAGRGLKESWQLITRPKHPP